MEDKFEMQDLQTVLLHLSGPDQIKLTYHFGDRGIGRTDVPSVVRLTDCIL